MNGLCNISSSSSSSSVRPASSLVDDDAAEALAALEDLDVARVAQGLVVGEEPEGDAADEVGQEPARAVVVRHRAKVVVHPVVLDAVILN